MRNLVVALFFAIQQHSAFGGEQINAFDSNGKLSPNSVQQKDDRSNADFNMDGLRKKVISGGPQDRTLEYRFIKYRQDWGDKVIRIAGLNYPEAAKGKIHGLVVLTVAIQADGSLYKPPIIVRSSEHQILDEAAVRIVQIGSPYAPFSPDIRRDTDIIVITQQLEFSPDENIGRYVNGAMTAKWVRIEGNNRDAESSTIYTDPSTLWKEGNRMKIWVLHDYKTPQNESTGKPYSSRRLHEEFDCEKRQARTLDFAVYSGNMGEGKELFSYGIPTEWSLFSQNTIVETLWKTVCGKN